MCASQRFHRRWVFVLPSALLWIFLANSTLAQTSFGDSTLFNQVSRQTQPEQNQLLASVSAKDLLVLENQNQNQAEPQQSAVSLIPGRTIDGVLKGGEARSYSLSLTSRQYMHAVVDQRGIDLVVVLRGPSGNQLFEMDGMVGPVGTEDLVWEAADAGNYTLELRARTAAAPQGAYTLWVEVRESAGVSEHAWIEAQRLYMEGRRAQNQGNGEGLQQASKAYGAALPEWRAAGEQKWEAATLHDLGVVRMYLGDFEQSRDSFEAALLISRAIKDLRLEARALNNLSGVYRNLREYEKGRERVQRALVIWRELRNRRGEAAALNGLGNNYALLHQIERARDYYEQALVIWREIKDRKFEGTTLINLGNIHAELDQFSQALNYFEQALAITRKEKALNDEAIVLHNFGEVYSKLEQLDKARDCFGQALAIYRELKNRSGEAFALMNLGKSYVDDNAESARGYLEQALAIWRNIKDPRSEAAVLLQLAYLARQKGDLDSAYPQASAALSIIESIRSRIAGQEQRSSFFASTRDYFELCIDVLMQMHRKDPKGRYDSEALAISERARARSLLDLLTEARAEILEGTDQRLIAKERELQRQLNATAAAQQQLLSGTHTADQVAAIEKKLTSVTGEYQDLQAQLRRTSTRYAALVQPQPLDLQAIQTRLLDNDTLLLVYSLGVERSYLWAVTPESLHSFELPKRELLEASVRRFRELLTPAQLKDPQSSVRRTLRAQLPQVEAAAGELSKMLLLPVASQLGTKRLLIVSDGALQYVPFAALPAPSVGTMAKRSQPHPLILGHEIVNLPSASTLAVMRDELSARPLASKSLAVIADPVFSAGDERLDSMRRATAKGIAVSLPVALSSETRAGKLVEGPAPAVLRRESGGADKSYDTPQTATGIERDFQTFLTRGSDGKLPRLPFARREAESIASFASPASTLKALDFKASRETAISLTLGQYRIVHFATHGLLNTERPELSGLVLSLVDEQGRAEDGFLRLHEIYNLHLPVELVVLSACQTALGKDIKGEGLIGLTRGFMHAGAARVVASLWRVDDVATAELMRRFYASMLRDGQRPAAALRTAQIGMWREGVWRSPYYWAGFVLQGEWR